MVEGIPMFLLDEQPGWSPKSEAGERRHEFSRCFSKHKVGHGFGAKTVFHSFRHTVSTILRSANADIGGEWIDATLGHEGADQSEGVRTYLKRIGPRNLRRTIEAIRSPKDVDTALDAFMIQATIAGTAIDH